MTKFKTTLVFWSDWDSEGADLAAIATALSKSDRRSDVYVAKIKSELVEGAEMDPDWSPDVEDFFLDLEKMYDSYR